MINLFEARVDLMINQKTKKEIHLKKVNEFIYHDGSIMSHFIDENLENLETNFVNQLNYIFLWCDQDEICNRWKVSEVTNLDLLKFLNSEISLHELMSQKNVYFIDLDNEITRKHLYFIETHKDVTYTSIFENADNEVNYENNIIYELDNLYVTGRDAYFDENNYEEDAVNLKNKLQQEYKNYKNTLDVNLKNE